MLFQIDYAVAALLHLIKYSLVDYVRIIGYFNVSDYFYGIRKFYLRIIFIDSIIFYKFNYIISMLL